MAPGADPHDAEDHTLVGMSCGTGAVAVKLRLLEIGRVARGAKGPLNQDKLKQPCRQLLNATSW